MFVGIFAFSLSTKTLTHYIFGKSEKNGKTDEVKKTEHHLRVILRVFMIKLVKFNHYFPNNDLGVSRRTM